MSEPPRIRAEEILVRYGKIIALDSFTASIPHGIVGILGPNGAGKTTFIKVLLGLVKPERGKFTINGRGAFDIRDIVGYMPESECLIESMNAFEMVSYMGCLSGMPVEDAIQRGHEVLDFVGIGEERYREIDSYSTGMKQRVKLAQAIVHDPEVLMLDEPTNGMDPEGREEMLELISRIGKFGKTILVSSHLLHEVEQVCEYMIIIDQGKLLKEGDMEKLLSPEAGRYRVKVRGETEAIKRFYKIIRERYKPVQVVNERGQGTIVLKGVDNSEHILRTAREVGVQIRYYRPDILSLEDVFLETFAGGNAHEN